MSLIPTGLTAKDPLEIGAPAPQINVVSEQNAPLQLADIYRQGPVLVYFYPKADTPGCTRQACNLRDHYTELQEAGIRILGVSSDSAADQAAFKAKYQLPFSLVADEDGRLAQGFGVGGLMGFYKRQSFLIVDGKVVWRDLSADPKTQAEMALEALRAVSAKTKP